MKNTSRILLCCAVLMAVTACLAQSTKPASGVSSTSPGTRYFQLTVLLKFPEGTDGLQQHADQVISTDVAVNNNRPGSCKTRVTSQVPIVTGGKTKFVELGTKFDCNDVHVDGDGLALSIVVETSNIQGMITTKSDSGVEMEEPIISQRKLELSAKLLLDTPKVIFDSKTVSHAVIQKLGSGTAPLKTAVQAPSSMQIEITATELK